MCEENRTNRMFVSNVATNFEERGNQLLEEAERINQNALQLLDHTNRRLKVFAAIERQQRDLLTVTIGRILELEEEMLAPMASWPHAPTQLKEMLERYSRIVEARLGTRRDSDMELDSSDVEVTAVGTSAEHVKVLNQAPSEIQVPAAFVGEFIDLTVEEEAHAGDATPPYAPVAHATASDTGAAALDRPEAIPMAIPTVNIVKAPPEQAPAVPRPRGRPPSPMLLTLASSLPSLTVPASTFPLAADASGSTTVVRPPSMERLGGSGSGTKRKSPIEEDAARKKLDRRFAGKMRAQWVRKG